MGSKFQVSIDLDGLLLGLQAPGMARPKSTNPRTTHWVSFPQDEIDKLRNLQELLDYLPESHRVAVRLRSLGMTNAATQSLGKLVEAITRQVMLSVSRDPDVATVLKSLQHSRQRGITDAVNLLNTTVSEDAAYEHLQACKRAVAELAKTGPRVELEQKQAAYLAECREAGRAPVRPHPVFTDMGAYVQDYEQPLLEWFVSGVTPDEATATRLRAMFPALDVVRSLLNTSSH